MRTPEQSTHKNSLRLNLGLIVMSVLAWGCGIVEAVTPTRIPGAHYFKNTPSIPDAEIIADFCTDAMTGSQEVSEFDSEPCWITNMAGLFGSGRAVLFNSRYATPGIGITLRTDNHPMLFDESTGQDWTNFEDVFAWSIGTMGMQESCENVLLTDNGQPAVLIEGTRGWSFYQDTSGFEDSGAIEGELDPTDEEVNLCAVLFTVKDWN